jgi:hypothetical protein
MSDFIVMKNYRRFVYLASCIWRRVFGVVCLATLTAIVSTAKPNGCGRARRWRGGVNAAAPVLPKAAVDRDCLNQPRHRNGGISHAV